MGTLSVLEFLHFSPQIHDCPNQESQSCYVVDDFEDYTFIDFHGMDHECHNEERKEVESGEGQEVAVDEESTTDSPQIVDHVLQCFACEENLAIVTLRYSFQELQSFLRICQPVNLLQADSHLFKAFVFILFCRLENSLRNFIGIRGPLEIIILISYTTNRSIIVRLLGNRTVSGISIKEIFAEVGTVFRFVVDALPFVSIQDCSRHHLICLLGPRADVVEESSVFSKFV